MSVATYTGCHLRDGEETQQAREVRQAAGAQDGQEYAEGGGGALSNLPSYFSVLSALPTVSQAPTCHFSVACLHAL